MTSLTIESWPVGMWCWKSRIELSRNGTRCWRTWTVITDKYQINRKPVVLSQLYSTCRQWSVMGAAWLLTSQSASCARPRKLRSTPMMVTRCSTLSGSTELYKQHVHVQTVELAGSTVFIKWHPELQAYFEGFSPALSSSRVYRNSCVGRSERLCSESLVSVTTRTQRYDIHIRTCIGAWEDRVRSTNLQRNVRTYLELVDLTGDVPHESLAEILHTVRSYQLGQCSQLCVTEHTQ